MASKSKTPKLRKPFLLGILVVVLIVLGVSLLNAGGEKYDWSEVELADMLPPPESRYGEIMINSESYLSLYVNKSTQEQYVQFVEACKEKGFTIDAETIGTFFCAYNEQGYELSLQYIDSSSEMRIFLSAGMELGVLNWPGSELAQMLPAPESTVGNIQQDDEKRFAVFVGSTTIDELSSYVEVCKDKGFTVGADKTDKHFSAKNADGYRLSIDYQGNSIIYISLEEPEYNVIVEVECVENWLFSKYDVDIYIDDNFQGTITHGDTETINLTLTKGTYVLRFVSIEDNELNGEVEFHIQKDVSLKYRISCSSSGVDVEMIEGSSSGDMPNQNETSQDSQPNEITLTMGEEEFKRMDYKEAEKIFREMGFTKFEYRTVDTEIESSADTICYIEITEWFVGDSDFAKGDKYNSDSTITFFSYKYEAPAAPAAVSYSTNDYETAKKGNSGVFSYRDRGGSYDIYWIIDFDEGYVYYFTEGNGETTCDRLKIESGTLNDAVTITYHYYGDIWSYRLHFKYVNHPETLIMVDNDGFDFNYSTTNLADALALRATKEIKDY